MHGGDIKVDPSILEAGVLELIDDTKAKISSLMEEIAALKLSEEQILIMLDKVSKEHDFTNLALAEVNDKVKQAKGKEESLAQILEKRQQDLHERKVHLAEELDVTEKRNSEIRIKIKRLAEDEKLLKESKELESGIISKKLSATKKNITKLQEGISIKDHEIAKLKAEWSKMQEKEALRIETLENEKRKLLAFFSNK